MNAREKNKQKMKEWRTNYHPQATEEEITLNAEDKKILKRWYIRRNLAPTTQDEYNTVLTQACNIINKHITQIYDEILDEEDRNITRQRRAYNDDIIDIQTYMKEYAQYTENTIGGKMSIIKSFYESLGVTITQLIGRYQRSANPDNVEQELPKELIKIMMQASGNQDKALISFIALTGQAQQEASNLTIQQLINSFNKEFGEEKIKTYKDLFKYREQILEIEVAQLKMYRQKVKGHYWTYLPREVTTHILNYLRERQYGRNQKIRITSNEEPVFVTKHGNKYTGDSLGKRVILIGKKCGFEEPENFEREIRIILQRKPGQQRVYKSHNLRKYFATTCARYGGGVGINNRVFNGKDLADFWLGHRDNRSINAYIQHSEDDNIAMKDMYLKVLPYLSLETEVRTFDDEEREEFENIKEEYMRMSEEVARMKEYIGLRKMEDELLGD